MYEIQNHWMSVELKEAMERVFFDPLQHPEWLEAILKNSKIGHQFKVTREQAEWITNSLKCLEENFNSLDKIQRNNLRLLYSAFDNNEYYLSLLGIRNPSY